jgi:hypothetical protein
MYQDKSVYIPRMQEDLHVTNGKVRLYHRTNGKHYISEEQNEKGEYIAWSSGKIGEGYITSPLYANPQRGKDVGTRLIVQIFLDYMNKMGVLENIYGLFNSEPLTEYNSVVASHPCSTESCPFRGTVSCPCCIRPGQVLTWGDLESGDFVALGLGGPIDTIEGRMTLTDLCAEMKKRMDVTAWNKFECRKSKIHSSVEEKVFANIQTQQRSSLNESNPYGLSLGFFDYALETWEEDGKIFVGLAIGLREPKKVWHKRKNKKIEQKFKVIKKKQKEEDFEDFDELTQLSVDQEKEFVDEELEDDYEELVEVENDDIEE